MRVYLTRALALMLALLTFCLCACTPKNEEKDNAPDNPSVDTPSTPDDGTPDQPTVDDPAGDQTPDDGTPDQPTPDTPVVPDEPTVADTSFLSFDFSKETAFLPTDIYDDSLYTYGLVPTKKNSEFYVEVMGEDHPTRSIVVPCEWGKCYEIKCPAGLSGLRVAVVNTDPRKAAVGTKISYESSMNLKYYANEPTVNTDISLMYVARAKGNYLVIYTGTDLAEVQILERTMVQSVDTQGLWFTPPAFGGFKGGEGSYADYRWTAKEFLNNLYESYRADNPGYITRELIGKDQSGKYDMYGYIYAPENYKSTLFITSGVHGDEETGYHGLAAFLSLVCEATEDGDPLLWFVRNNVRLIVIPIVNVWAASQDPTVNRNNLRYNSTKTDLNRNFDSLSQAESKNVIKFFEKYAHEIDMMIDCHTASGKDISLYYNFINFSENAVANYKTTNHMYHRFMELGHIGKTPSIAKIPGSYSKGSQYLEGIIWNRFKVPTITVEHADYKSADSRFGSGSEVTLACEVYGNFIIQNALYYCNKK